MYTKPKENINVCKYAGEFTGLTNAIQPAEWNWNGQ